MIGEKFEKLLVLEELPERNKDRRILFNCLCDCGNSKVTTGKSLRSGRIVSCGCHYVPAKDPNAMKRHYLYRTYNAMKTRCYNTKTEAYRWYGERGITVCERWLDSFWNFVEDVGERPEGKTLDRVDNNKGYDPDNFRWATVQEQMDNRRPNSGWRKKKTL